MAESGWYRVEGDPEGALRRWNGEQWVGEPIVMPGAAVQAEPQSAGWLSTTGAVMATLAVTGLVAQFGLLVLLLVRLEQGVQRAPSRFFLQRTIGSLDEVVPGIWGLATLTLVIGIATVVPFGAWLDDAVAATKALTSAQMRRNGKAIQQALIMVGFFIIGPVLTLIYFLKRHTARTDRREHRRPSIMTMITLVIEKVNRQSEPDISPIKVLVWWVLLWASLFVGFMTWMWAWVFGHRNPDALPEVLRMFEFIVVMLLISLIACIWIVVSISRRLGFVEMIRKPSQ